MKNKNRIVDFFAINLQRKLLLLVLVLVIPVMGGMSVYWGTTQRNAASTELRQRAGRMADLLSQSLAAPLWNLDENVLRAQLVAVLADPDLFYIGIYEMNRATPMFSEQRDGEPVDAIEREGLILYTDDRGVTTLGAVKLIYTHEHIYREITRAQYVISAFVLGLGGILALGLYLLMRQLVEKPILQMSAIMANVAEGDFSARVVLRSRDEIGQLARALNWMTERLHGSVEQLEDRVQERTQALERRTTYLEVTAEVGQVATSTLDVDILMQQVVDLIQERLGIYYVGLFLIEPTQEWVVLRAGTGSVGQQLRERDLRVPLGAGSLVGSSILNRRAYVIQDVTQDKMRLALPELPDTRSEAALPLQVRGEVIGALTVEDDKLGTFDAVMVNVLQSTVDQVAVALQNARLFSELQVALEAERRAYGDMVGEAWAERIGGQGALHYTGESDGQVKVLHNVIPASDLLAAQRHGQQIAGEQQANVTFPIKVRERAVGAIQFRKPGEAQSWSVDEMELLQTLTEQLSVALESARLYEDTQRRAAREQLTGEVAARMRETLDMDAILQTAIREMGERLGIAEVEVRMGVEE